jgi:hypothetical protein
MAAKGWHKLRESDALNLGFLEVPLYKYWKIFESPVNEAFLNEERDSGDI